MVQGKGEKPLQNEVEIYRILTPESMFYRILRENNQQHNRGRGKSPNRKAPASHGATTPDQVWPWDIIYLRPRRSGADTTTSK